MPIQAVNVPTAAAANVPSAPADGTAQPVIADDSAGQMVGKAMTAKAEEVAASKSKAKAEKAPAQRRPGQRIIGSFRGHKRSGTPWINLAWPGPVDTDPRQTNDSPKQDNKDPQGQAAIAALNLASASNCTHSGRRLCQSSRRNSPERSGSARAPEVAKTETVNSAST